MLTVNLGDWISMQGETENGKGSVAKRDRVEIQGKLRVLSASQAQGMSVFPGGRMAWRGARVPCFAEHQAQKKDAAGTGTFYEE